MKYLSEKDIGMEIFIDSLIEFKKTARYSTKYYGHDKEGTNYIIVGSQLPIQKFYLKRALEGEKMFKSSGITNICINSAQIDKEFENEAFAIYKLMEGQPVNKLWNPNKLLLQFYHSQAAHLKRDDNLTNHILSNFLDAWPSNIHSQIRKLPEFQMYENILNEYDTLDLILEHGDFTPNNIIQTEDGNFLLLDYEFVKCMQPIGFDMYDWHMSHDKIFDKIPNLELNTIKYQLVMKANRILDLANKPQVEIDSRESVKANEFIYNRYDLIYDNDFSVYKVSEQGSSVFIPFHKDGIHGEIGVWQTPMSEWAFYMLINKIFHDNFIVDLKIRYSQNQYKKCLSKTNHFHISLPESNVDIQSRMKKKARYNLNRSRIHLANTIGDLQFKTYASDSVPDEIILKYFLWKQETHGTDYHMSPDELIRNYHISHIYVLESLSGQAVAILFTCEQCQNVYLENISYDLRYAKFSPGMILYTYTLQTLIRKGKQKIFLGNGEQSYKMHFGSINTVAYSGTVYRIEAMNILGTLFSSIHEYLLNRRHRKAYENDNRGK